MGKEDLITFTTDGEICTRNEEDARAVQEKQEGYLQRIRRRVVATISVVQPSRRERQLRAALPWLRSPRLGC